MYLIAEPFISNFLIQTIKSNNAKVIATKAAKQLIADPTLNWISEEAALTTLKQHPNLPLYSNSENALSWIEEHLAGTERLAQIKTLKNKLQFRTLIKDLFPDFYFKALSLQEIHQLHSKELPFPFVIKPAIGFFSIGVHIVKNEADWEHAKRELHPEQLKSIFPESVLDTNTFIIEQFIEGEEFAIDYYHDREGKVVLLNSMHHVFSSGTDTSDRVYTTSKDIITKYKAPIENFLSTIGEQLHLKNFPAHAEVRINEDGTILPIEINPLRFGGWCTTGDLLGLTLGFNSYEYFFNNKKPDWEALFDRKADQLFSIIILNNSTGITAANISSFDYNKLAGDLENPVLIRELDIHQYPVFGFVFAETSAPNQQELTEILTSDLKKYITLAP